MRDDSHRWEAPPAPDVPVALNGAVLTPAGQLRQVLVSGPDVRASAGAPLVGWPDPAPVGPCALSLRRDRILLVGGPAMAEGWDGAGRRALTDVSDGWAVFDFSGPAAFALLRRGAEIDLETPSASVVRLLFGLEVLLYRTGSGQGFRLHVGRARAPALVHSFRTCAALAGD